MNVSYKIMQKRAKKLARGSIRLQRGLFISLDVWKNRRKAHDSNVQLVDSFFKNYKQKTI